MKQTKSEEKEPAEIRLAAIVQAVKNRADRRFEMPEIASGHLPVSRVLVMKIIVKLHCLGMYLATRLISLNCQRTSRR